MNSRPGVDGLLVFATADSGWLSFASKEGNARVGGGDEVAMKLMRHVRVLSDLSSLAAVADVVPSPMWCGEKPVGRANRSGKRWW